MKKIENLARKGKSTKNKMEYFELENTVTKLEE